MLALVIGLFLKEIPLGVRGEPETAEAVTDPVEADASSLSR